MRWPRLESLVKNEPALLVHLGKFLPEAMRRERVTESEIRSAVRGSGFSDIEPGLSVVLETDGTFSVVTGSRATPDNEPDAAAEKSVQL